MATFALAKMLRCTVVVSYWSTPDTHRFSQGPVAWLRRAMFRWSDAIYTPGTAARRAALLSGATEGQVVCGFPTIDTATFNRIGLRTHTEPADETPRKYIYVGQLIKRKNIAALIEAFSDISEPGDSLLLVGQGPERDNLVQLSCDLGLSRRVEFLGHLQPSDLRTAYARADTLILPSVTEVWGLVVNEALHCGLRVVVSERCGVAADAKFWPGVIISGTTRNDLSTALNKIQSVPMPAPGHPVESQTPHALAELLVSTLLKRSR
ncbi:MAG: glycosyltransferase family 4 protein [Coriobacteriales bacterium]|nr:glycosyltransferase family 4 protein [Coriobacteriales bacterium]